ncbi:basic proline-rich protein-like [Enhydra lutris kenyoni]|uniref:Basic proline-rich protein-like n=1 Tax=Enhydra lutris kenyoni TaxID=391180 RepID=A0A2Y9KZ35_ENHLU|nr:basic proline-rich protein-like [Enhydra lutris kenyoni]
MDPPPSGQWLRARGLDFSHSRTAPAAGAPGPAGVESSARRGLTTSLSSLGLPGPVPRLPAPAPLRLSPHRAPRQGPQTQCTDSPAQLLPDVEKAAGGKLSEAATRSQPSAPAAARSPARSSYCFSDSWCQEPSKAPQLRQPGAGIPRHPPQPSPGYSRQPRTCTCPRVARVGKVAPGDVGPRSGPVCPGAPILASRPQPGSRSLTSGQAAWLCGAGRGPRSAECEHGAGAVLKPAGSQTQGRSWTSRAQWEEAQLPGAKWAPGSRLVAEPEVAVASRSLGPCTPAAGALRLSPAFLSHRVPGTVPSHGQTTLASALLGLCPQGSSAPPWAPAEVTGHSHRSLATVTRGLASSARRLPGPVRGCAGRSRRRQVPRGLLAQPRWRDPPGGAPGDSTRRAAERGAGSWLGPPSSPVSRPGSLALTSEGAGKARAGTRRPEAEGGASTGRPGHRPLTKRGPVAAGAVSERASAPGPPTGLPGAPPPPPPRATHPARGWAGPSPPRPSPGPPPARRKPFPGSGGGRRRPLRRAGRQVRSPGATPAWPYILPLRQPLGQRRGRRSAQSSVLPPVFPPWSAF